MENYHKNGRKSRFNTMGSLTKTNTFCVSKTVPEKLIVRTMPTNF